MKPLEAGSYLRQVRDAVFESKTLPPSVIGWFCLAVAQRFSDPASNLDQLLRLRSREGGRLTLGCTIPDRDNAIRYLAASLNLPKANDQAKEIIRLRNAGELARIEALGRIPGKERILQIIRK